MSFARQPLHARCPRKAIWRWTGFSATKAPRRGAKLAYVKLNIPTPCPPRGAVPANAWDGENRLIELKRDTSTPTLSSRQRLVFEYDAQGRRIRKQFYTHNGTTWVEQRDTICLYDGWNVVAELDANASNTKLRTYVWGNDASGTLEGAGGVGGLLWVNNTQTTYDGQTLPTGVHFVAYDGNGNVLALVKATDGSLSARYEYGPFGEPARVSGALADAQPFRFSTKWTDAESGLLYYGYRYYNPTTGRWLSKDPAQELGGVNLYQALLNNPIITIDSLGLTPRDCPKCGGDVTMPFERDMIEIDLAWLAWNRKQKEAVCDALLEDAPLIGPVLHRDPSDKWYYKNAWWMWKLAVAGDCDYPSGCQWRFARPSRKGTGICDGTVGYYNGCYQARDLHYKMFGKLGRKCYSLDTWYYRLWYSEERMVEYVWGWKLAHREGAYIPCAVAFTRAGYNDRGRPPSDALCDASPWCERDPDNMVYDAMQWHWAPCHVNEPR